MHNDFQHQFLERILQFHPKKTEAVDQLAELLSVGKDAVYRRIRGETALTANELQILAQQYNVSTDSLMYAQDSAVLCNYSGFDSRNNSVLDYLEGVYNNIQQVIDIPDVEVFYGFQEIPLFHYMFFPELIQFKLYIWGQTTLSGDLFQNKPFSFDLLPYPALQLIEKIIKWYVTVPSSELLSLGLVDNSLNQIEYMLSVGNFENPTDALTLCDRLGALMEHLRSMAEQGSKSMPGHHAPETPIPFNLYHNELVAANNIMVVTANEQLYLFSALCNPNFLSSVDQKLCLSVKDWLENMYHKSNAISSHSAKNRNWFFNKVQKRISSTRQRIEMQWM